MTDLQSEAYVTLWNARQAVLHGHLEEALRLIGDAAEQVARARVAELRAESEKARG